MFALPPTVDEIWIDAVDNHDRDYLQFVENDLADLEAGLHL